MYNARIVATRKLLCIRLNFREKDKDTLYQCNGNSKRQEALEKRKKVILTVLIACSICIVSIIYVLSYL